MAQLVEPGFPQALEIMENLENDKKSSMHGKIMEFERKKLNNHGKIMEFCDFFFDKTTISRNLAVGQFSGYWWFQVLIISKCMHGLQACFKYIKTLLLLHVRFMLSVMKISLKREVGIVMEITLLIRENHVKIMELCFCISVGIL